MKHRERQVAEIAKGFPTGPQRTSPEPLAFRTATLSLAASDNRKAIESARHREPTGLEALRVELEGVNMSGPVRPGKESVPLGREQWHTLQPRDRWGLWAPLALVVSPARPWPVAAGSDQPFGSSCYGRRGSRPVIGSTEELHFQDRSRFGDSLPTEPADSLPDLTLGRRWRSLRLDYRTASPKGLLVPCWGATDFALPTDRDWQTQPGVYSWRRRGRSPDSGIGLAGNSCRLPEREGTR